MYRFWYDYVKLKNQNNAKLYYMDTESLLFMLKLRMFMKILQMMLKKDLIHQIMKSTDHYLQEKIKK